MSQNHRRLALELETRSQQSHKENSQDFYTEQDTHRSPFYSRTANNFKLHRIGFYRGCIISSVCWIIVTILCGTVFGITAYNYSLQIDYKTICNGNTICSVDFILDNTYGSSLFLYVLVSPFYQNNIYYESQLDRQELAGRRVGNCIDYNTFKEFNQTETVGGYRKSATFRASPCGYSLNDRFNDSFILLDSTSNILQLNAATTLTTAYYKGNQFKRANNYLLTQWLDVEDPLLINWLSPPTTNDKMLLVGSISNIPSGNYTIVINNLYVSNSSKKLLLKTANSLGSDNYTLGFSLLSASVVMFLFTIWMCFRKKSSDDI